ncbi:MAG: hypothetical protein WA012_01570 [Rhodoferax sp.]|uniref:hypothetical protein n=1 Tax=Rhodoferax sp. TaxID=50421 RepID=UPI003BB188E6
MPTTTIHRINDRFDQAFRGLSMEVPSAEVRQLAMLVYQCMEAKTRTYHAAFHVLALCEDMQPIQVLAALFHDVVLYQVDDGVPACVSALLENVMHHEPAALRLLEIAPDDQALALCVDIFGFHPGQHLSPRHGMNEFLSAVVAVRLLQAHLSAPQLIAIVACIELTIPFRAPDARGHSAAQRLAQRVQARCTKLTPAVFDSDPSSAAFVKTTVINAVDLANRDVTGFVEASPEYCLINSMLLVEESLMPRAASDKSSLSAYRGALLGMDTFLSHLSPVWVGQSFEGHPDANQVVQMQATARQNITFVRDYLAAVLSSVAILEALARSAGTRVAMAVSFLGMHCAEEARFASPAARSMFNGQLHQLLKTGLEAQENPGLSPLPLAACIYRCLGQEGTLLTLQQARQMFAGMLTPRAFLQSLDQNVVCAVIRNTAEMDASHKAALLALEHSLYSVVQ